MIQVAFLVLIKTPNTARGFSENVKVIQEVMGHADVSTTMNISQRLMKVLLMSLPKKDDRTEIAIDDLMEGIVWYKVRNIKSYLLAALFNAGLTVSSYYQAEMNQDMPLYAS